MTLCYKTASLQTKRDIIDAVVDCFNVAFKHQGYVYGLFVSDVIVPVYNDESFDSTNGTLAELLKGKEESINMRQSSIWFPSDNELDKFVAEMGESLIPFESDGNKAFTLTKLTAKIINIWCYTEATVFKPYLQHNTSNLGYSNINGKHVWRLITDETENYRPLMQEIKDKCVTLTNEYILEIHNKINDTAFINYKFELLKKWYLLEGWQVDLGDFSLNKSDNVDTFISLIKRAAEPLLDKMTMRGKTIIDKADIKEALAGVNFMLVGLTTLKSVLEKLNGEKLNGEN